MTTDDPWHHRDQPSPAAAQPSDALSPTDQAGEPASTRKKRRLPFLVELPLLVLVAFALAVLLKTFLVQAFYIPSASMVPTLEVNDRILVNKVVFQLREPERGDIVVFHEQGGGPSGIEGALSDLAAGLGIVPPAQKDFVKRIIGLPGETLEVRDGVVFINDQRLQEATVQQGGYLRARGNDDFGPVRISEGKYFLMGDNRRNSADSRSSLGTVQRDEIVGRAFVVIWPPSNADVLTSPDLGLSLSPPPDSQAGAVTPPVVADEPERAPGV